MKTTLCGSTGRRPAWSIPATRYGRICASAALLVLLLAPLGCKHQRAQKQQVEEEAPTLASVVRMGDPKLASQLLSGVHGIEANSWRWTARQFAIALRPPVGAVQKGGVLTLRVTVPPVVIEKEKSVTLSASIGGTPLAPEPYAKAGEYVYKRDVPANLLTGDVVRVDFELDKAMPPSGGDARELGIILLSAALESK